MSVISYEFILAFVIIELVFAFSIGVTCILFSYYLFRAIKQTDFESIDEVCITQPITKYDHIYTYNTLIKAERFENESKVPSSTHTTPCTPKKHHNNSHNYGSMSNPATNTQNSTVNDYNHQSNASPSQYPLTNSNSLLKPKQSPPYRASISPNLNYISFPSHDVTGPRIDSKVDEYFIDDKLSEFDVERRVDNSELIDSLVIG